MSKQSKQPSVGAEIIAGLTEFRDALRDGHPIEDRFTIRTIDLDLHPSKYDADTVRETRDLLNMSQAVFARFLGASIDTVQAWEQGRREPSPMACRFMDELRSDPKHWMERLRELTKGNGQHQMS